jgi:hypothetical protein
VHDNVESIGQGSAGRAEERKGKMMFSTYAVHSRTVLASVAYILKRSAEDPISLNHTSCVLSAM